MYCHLIYNAGVYQTCTVSGRYLHTSPCSGMSHVNPKTGGHSCPQGYTGVNIYQGSKLGRQESRRTCRRYGWSIAGLIYLYYTSSQNKKRNVFYGKCKEKPFVRQFKSVTVFYCFLFFITPFASFINHFCQILVDLLLRCAVA